MLKMSRLRRFAKGLCVTLSVSLFALGLPIGAYASSDPGIPPDLSTGFSYAKTIALASQPVQAVYASDTGQYATLNSSGNLSLYDLSGTELIPTVTFLENDAQNFGPDLVSDAGTDALYWINLTTNDIESLNLGVSHPQITVLAHDPNLPEYLSLGPSGQHLYVIDQGTSGNGDIGQLALSDPAAGFATLGLTSTADAPAAVYQSISGPIAFIPSAFPDNANNSGGSILRVSFSGSAHALSPLSDPSIPSGVAVSQTGALVVSQSDANTVNLVEQASQATPEWLPATTPPSAISGLAGQLQVGLTGQISVLGTTTTSNPVWMVYNGASGIWTEPNLGAPQGPLTESDGIIVSPTSSNQLSVLAADQAASLFPLANTLPAPLTASSVQGIAADDGTLWIPNQNGAAVVSPVNGSIETSVGTTYGPTGGIALSPTGTLLLTTDNPSGVFSPSTGTLTPTTDGSTPIALSTTANGSVWSLNTTTTGTELWNPDIGTTLPLSFSAQSLIISSTGPVAAGGGTLAFSTPKALLSNPAYTGPMALSADGSLIYSASALGAGVTVTALDGPALLGSVALPMPSLGSGQTLAGLTDLAVSPHGTWLYALTANAIIVYQGPHLTLSATSLTPSVGTKAAITATLVNSAGQGVPGETVQLASGASEVTNTAGQASFLVRVNEIGPLTVSASASGVTAALTLTGQSLPPSPTPTPSPIPSPQPNPPAPSITSPPSTSSPTPPTHSDSPPPSSSSASSSSSGLSSPPPVLPPPPPTPPPSNPAVKHSSVPWTIILRHPQNDPALQLDGCPSAQIAHPPGKALQTFAINVTGRRVYPTDYQIEVIAPPNFHGHYGLWYFSRPAWRWYPLLPVRISPRIYVASISFLTTMAITRERPPTAFDLTAPTWTQLSVMVADLTHPDGAIQARVFSVKALTHPIHRALHAISMPTLLKGGAVDTLDLVAALAHLDPNHVLLDANAGGTSLQGFAQLLRQRGFQVKRLKKRPKPIPTPAISATGRLLSSTPQLIWEKQTWSPLRLQWLRQLNPTLVRPGFFRALPKNALVHQETLIRHLHLPHPFETARQYATQVADRDAHAVVVGLGSNQTGLQLFSQEVASAYHATVIWSPDSKNAWRAFDLGYVPSFVLTLEIHRFKRSMISKSPTSSTKTPIQHQQASGQAARRPFSRG